jgi:hypothetical protein
MDEGMRAEEAKDRFQPCQVDWQREYGIIVWDGHKDFVNLGKKEPKLCPFPCPNSDCKDCQ